APYVPPRLGEPGFGSLAPVQTPSLPPGPSKELALELTHSSRAGIPFSTFAEPELVKYKSFDGLEIPAWYYPPSKNSALGTQNSALPPVIVYPHGGPESQTRPNFNALFQYFLQAGYGI